jgi:FixJ family two-component response regulator
MEIHAHAPSDRYREHRSDPLGDHRVYIVDDDDSFRTSLTRLLEVYGLSTVACRCVGEYLITDRPDCASCIVLDVFMPGPSGLQLIDALAKQDSAPPVVFVTACGDVPATVQAMKAGAVDFLTKPLDMGQLLRSVRRAIALDAARRASRHEKQQVHDCYIQLTPFERDVFVGVVSGKLNKQLAVRLGICERSIKSYRSRVMQKMQVSSLAGLVRTAKVLDLATHF